MTQLENDKFKFTSKISRLRSFQFRIVPILLARIVSLAFGFAIQTANTVMVTNRDSVQASLQIFRPFKKPFHHGSNKHERDGRKQQSKRRRRCRRRRQHGLRPLVSRPVSDNIDPRTHSFGCQTTKHVDTTGESPLNSAGIPVALCCYMLMMYDVRYDCYFENIARK
jgi:hypothetical protein